MAITAEDHRYSMVQLQIRDRGITNERLLEAMKKVPRHLFAKENDFTTAYGDFPLPIGCDQTISQPYIVAYMTDVLELSATDRVLEIGTGCGYQTAVLAELVDHVYTIEIKQALSMQAKETLEALGYTNITFKTGSGRHGWPEEAPFDAVMVTAAPQELPPALPQQLAQGGRLIIPLGITEQTLVCYRKIKNKLTSRRLIAVRFVPLL